MNSGYIKCVNCGSYGISRYLVAEVTKYFWLPKSGNGVYKNTVECRFCEYCGKLYSMN